jgi:peptidoglycan/LPS O-acetylase OafA/YrhL
MKLSDAMAGRDNNFNLIRMIAATGVLVSHAWPICTGIRESEPFMQTLGGISLGICCVLVFFSISGFFIAQSFERSADLPAFVRARALRLFPALLVVLVISVLVLGFFISNAPSGLFWTEGVAYVARNLTLYRPLYPLPGVFEDNPLGNPINGSLWTLRYEVTCYLALTLVALLGVLKRPLGMALLLGLMGVGTMSTQSLSAPHVVHYLFFLGFPFAFGMMVYVWRDVVPLNVSLLIVLVLATIVFGQIEASDPLFRMLLTITLAYGAFLIGYHPLLRFRAYNRLGDYSYGMYIYAFPIQQLIVWMGVTHIGSHITVAFLAALICAVLSWMLIERPALALKSARSLPLERKTA